MRDDAHGDGDGAETYDGAVIYLTPPQQGATHVPRSTDVPRNVKEQNAKAWQKMRDCGMTIAEIADAEDYSESYVAQLTRAPASAHASDKPDGGVTNDVLAATQTPNTDAGSSMFTEQSHSILEGAQQGADHESVKMMLSEHVADIVIDDITDDEAGFDELVPEDRRQEVESLVERAMQTLSNECYTAACDAVSKRLEGALAAAHADDEEADSIHEKLWRLPFEVLRLDQVERRWVDLTAQGYVDRFEDEVEDGEREAFTADDVKSAVDDDMHEIAWMIANRAEELANQDG